VIDTGYVGSILNAIRSVDETVSGYLLSKKAHSRYPQLLTGYSHRDKVEKLESFSKIIGRASTYTDKGGAVAKRTDVEKNDVDATLAPGAGQNRWYVESHLRQVFKAAGLPPWDAWRYSQYVGLTPAERLGVNTQAEVQAHYAKVEQLRNAARNAI
jgi:hypothetical protein